MSSVCAAAVGTLIILPKQKYDGQWLLTLRVKIEVTRVGIVCTVLSDSRSITLSVIIIIMCQYSRSSPFWSAMFFNKQSQPVYLTQCCGDCLRYFVNYVGKNANWHVSSDFCKLVFIYYLLDRPV